MSRNTVAALGIGLCVAQLGMPCAARELHPAEQDAAADLVIGSAAPALQLATVLQAPDGFATTWDALAGRVVVLEFWATWCAPCLPALDHLGELQARFADRPVTVIGISPEDGERMSAFLARRQVGFPIALDAGRATFDAYGVHGVPTTVVVDREGRIAARTRPEELNAEVLERVLAGQPAGLAFRTDVVADIDWQPTLDDEGEVFASVVIGPSSATGGGTRFEPGSGRMSGDGMQLDNLIQLAWDVPPSRLIKDGVPPWSRGDPVWKLSVLAPGGDDALARLMLQSALRAKFGLEARWEEREVDVRVLRRSPDGPAWVQSTAPESERTSSAFGGGLSTVGEPVEYLRAWFENILQKPVIDETGLAGEYDVAMNWVDGPTFLAEVTRVGLALESARRPVRFLVVTPR